MISEAARRLRVTRPTIRRRVKDGTLEGWFHPFTDRCFVFERSVKRYETDDVPDEDDGLSLSQAAAILGVADQTVARWIELGEIKGWRNSLVRKQSYTVSARSLRAFIERHESARSRHQR